MWILCILRYTSRETWKREVLCLLLTNKICERRNKLQSLLNFLLSVFVLPLCGISLFISLFQGNCYAKFWQLYPDTVVLLMCIICYLLWHHHKRVLMLLICFMQLKMRVIRNEGIFLCNCKVIIKFDLKYPFSSINPFLLPFKTNV
jgi:hypothetical protein